MLSEDPPSPTSAPPSKARKLQVLGALTKYRDFRYLWYSDVFTLIASWMQIVVLGWLALELTGSTFLLALFAAARFVPGILGPIGGVLADRMNRIKLILAATFAPFMTVAVLASLISIDRIEYWHILLGGFVLGLSQAPARPARMTALMDIVDKKEDVANAVALNIFAMYGTRVVGPAIGGVLFAVAGPATALWISVLWYGVAGASLLPIWHLGQRGASSRSAASPLRDLVQGFRIVLSNRNLLAVLSISMSTNALAWPVIHALMPVFAKEVLDAGPDGLGFLLAAAATGGVVATLTIAALGNVGSKGKIAIAGPGMFGLLLAAFASSSSYPISLVLIGVAGFFSGIFTTMQRTLILLLAPEQVRGRAIGMQSLAGSVIIPGSLALGGIASAIGVAWTVTISGSLLALNMLALYIWLPSLRRFR